MNLSILNTDVQNFINEHLDTEIPKLLFKGTHFENVTTLELIEQIEAKKKSQLKLPSWFASENVYFPNKLNIEQTSSEQTAEYKSQLIKGKTLIDITGGFGVDSYYFSKQFDAVVHCEINTELSKIAQHNFTQLQANGVTTVCKDGISALQHLDQKFDWLYVDPSRRHDSKGKVFFLEDCLPNIPKHLDAIFEHTQNVAIKTSPLLDLSVGIKELKFVKCIHIIAVDNEVKELLWILEKNNTAPIEVKTVNLKKVASEFFSFKLKDEASCEVQYSLPRSYLYEPNAAILKSGAFKSVSDVLNLDKLHQHSHLYTSDQLVEFPGRSFKIKSVLSYNKKEFKATGIKKANVTTRNFPDTVQQIRKKLNIKDGGTDYLFFTTDLNQKNSIISCEKIN
ncbi:class I SAM-dependent methyltransferase [Sediminibacter sp. Hel_I_10]|uniref:THUMP-like domain-containing protein n=1 Tax=Sediminibacter sp. Hel_I_10 TaxID=1392490 RepID=UPI00047A7548|nr:class I SAM-dependent methyltransferase [Sediminibacter sp. Hel_I_10]